MHQTLQNAGSSFASVPFPGTTSQVPLPIRVHLSTDLFAVSKGGSQAFHTLAKVPSRGTTTKGTVKQPRSPEILLCLFVYGLSQMDAITVSQVANMSPVSHRVFLSMRPFTSTRNPLNSPR